MNGSKLDNTEPHPCQHLRTPTRFFPQPTISTLSPTSMAASSAVPDMPSALPGATIICFTTSFRGAVR